ncbi:iron-containing redox enzyme family protein [Solicola sp. PLA-1-18]|uniref:iron-containing redox enzyme family protein n=1 Tax=Solicola sp. PLA-1-18 TaxID=3380532 RepID=UPI003B75DAEE
MQPPSSTGREPGDLPLARGPVSRLVLDLLTGDPDGAHPLVHLDPDGTDPLADEDLQIALWACYELHFRGFTGVDPEWEWAPALLHVRRQMEKVVLDHLLDAVALEVDEAMAAPGDLATRFFDLTESFPGPALSSVVGRQADRDQVLEFLAHRSVYQLKEADPHTFVVPRLEPTPKATFMEIQFDEYGAGRPDRVHQRLFAKTMAAAGLDDGYAAYVDAVPAQTLALGNIVSLLGLHRRWRGAAVGHLAAVEATSSLPCRLYASGVRRVGLDDEVAVFFDEHVEADAVHEQLAVRGICGSLVEGEPELERDVFLGAAFLLHGEVRFAEMLLAAWADGTSALASQPVRESVPA